MKTVIAMLVCFGLALNFSSCGKKSDDSLVPDEGDSIGADSSNTIKTKDTIDFRVLVYIDKASVEGHLGGSERIVESRMKSLLRNVSNYWNESAHGKLDAIYHFTMADMKIYKGSSQAPAFRKKVYNDPIDFNKYDVTILFDCLYDNGEIGNGGAAEGSGSDYRSVITDLAHPGESLDIFNDNTYQTLAHELGHYRGITDLYQYTVAVKDNPVSNQAFEGPKSIMNAANAGEWGDYAIGCLNRSAGYKQIGKKFPDFFGSMYPQKIKFAITADGKPLADARIRLYGERASYRDIWPDAFVSGKTDKDGVYTLTNTIQYYEPNRSKFDNLPQDLPWGRWFGFLAEVSGPANAKKYVWLPEYEVQMPFFEGKDTYNINVSF